MQDADDLSVIHSSRQYQHSILEVRYHSVNVSTTMSITFRLYSAACNFHGRDEQGCLYSLDCHFKSGSLVQAHISSILAIRPMKSLLPFSGV
ncbi:hypothetical protein NPIL_54951 [Nephila pilipes]|uniref:Uncharacterized protein n=1 Tax=Nephila pilipes TaxID=299642 RepID=A0A8X6UGS0_NEPPI|nr:hypothetical protein NPIL_54951 [Nephila pilipes]